VRGTEGGTTYVDSAMNAGECEEDSSHSEMRDRTIGTIEALVGHGTNEWLGGTNEWHPVTTVCGHLVLSLHTMRSLIPGAEQDTPGVLWYDTCDTHCHSEHQNELIFLHFV